MRKILPGYFFLFFLSFITFTWIFHTAAHAQSGVVVSPESQNPQTPPTPTIFVKETVQYVPAEPTQAPQVTAPTPTIYIAPPPSSAKEIEVTPSPTEEPVKPTVAVLPTATPTPVVTDTPTPQPVVSGPVDLEALFTKYSGEFGVDRGLLMKIAKCESGFNPTSNNSGIYLGMFQFGSQTWIANRNRMGLDPNPDLRVNPEEAIRTAAYLISKSGPGAWPNCH